MTPGVNVAVCLDKDPGEQRDVMVSGDISDIKAPAGKLLLEGCHILDDRLLVPVFVKTGAIPNIVREYFGGYFFPLLC